jgi:hypothetical protein
VGGVLAHEADGSTDEAAWCTREDLATMRLVSTSELGVRLAYAPS